MAFENCYAPYTPSEMEKANAVKLLLETAKLNGLEITTSLYMDLISKVYTKPFVEKLAEKCLNEEEPPIKEMTTTTIYK